MLNKKSRVCILITLLLCALFTMGCGGSGSGTGTGSYYVSNGVSLSEEKAQDFKKEFELSSSRIQKAIDVPLDESAATSYKKEIESDPYPNARVWSEDINSASSNIDKASAHIAKRSEILNQSLSEIKEE